MIHIWWVIQALQLCVASQFGAIPVSLPRVVTVTIFLGSPNCVNLVNFEYIQKQNASSRLIFAQSILPIFFVIYSERRFFELFSTIGLHVEWSADRFKRLNGY